VVTVIPDFTLIMQMVVFLSLVFILNALLYKPLLSIIARRKKQLDELENEIKLYNESVAKKATEYEEKLKLAKTNASELKKQMIQEGADQAKIKIDAVRNEIPLLMQDFQQKMDKEVQIARQTLGSQSRKLSLEIAQKVMGRQIQ
jgi:F-type H+-transporting ATPase subunit b